MNWHSPLVHSFVTVQVVGFPIAFLLRAAMRFYRAVRGEQTARIKNFLEAGANVCFAATSIAFAFDITIGIILLIAGIGLSVRALICARKHAIVAVAEPRRQILKSNKKRKRARA